MLHGHQTNAFYRFLVTPTAILGPYSQAIGTVRGIHEGAAYFSPNGSRYAWHSRSRGIRHPIREARLRREQGRDPVYP